jgi:hypothetical protein
MYRQLTEHQIIPTWSTHLAYGFGSPVLLFNYAFPYYLASLFISWGATLLQSFQIVTALSYIGMFGFMYLLLVDLTNPLSALVGATIYTWAPYHFDIVQHRGAMGEFTAMIFWPAVIWTTRMIFKKTYAKGLLLGSVFWALLLYSHADLYIMIFPVWLLLVFYTYLSTKNLHGLILSFYSMILGTGMMAFYFLPAYLEHGNLGYLLHEDIIVENCGIWTVMGIFL